MKNDSDIFAYVIPEPADRLPIALKPNTEANNAAEMPILLITI